jgi:glycine C-acetyltransferase
MATTANSRPSFARPITEGEGLADHDVLKNSESPSRLLATSPQLSAALRSLVHVGRSHGELFERQNLGPTGPRISLGPPGRAQLNRVANPRVDVLNLAANSYLGIANDPGIRAAAASGLEQHGLHMGGSRLLCGTAEGHWKLEQSLATFFQAQSVVTYSSGYLANISAISTLFGPDDLVVLDRNAHRSIYDGAVLSKAMIRRFAHNDLNHLERILNGTTRFRRRLVAVDGVYSMEGHIAPIPELVRLVQRHEAFLFVDDAHAIGVLGTHGRGTFEHFRMEPDVIDIRVGTLSKAIPAVGGFVMTSADVGALLRYVSHGTLYSAPLTPPDVAAAMAAVEIMATQPDLVRQLQGNAAFFRSELALRGLNTMGSQTAIVPVWVGDRNATLDAAVALLERGVYLNPVIYPGIRRGAERLRCFVMASHTHADLHYAAEAIADVLTP